MCVADRSSVSTSQYSSFYQGGTASLQLFIELRSNYIPGSEKFKFVESSSGSSFYWNLKAWSCGPGQIKNDFRFKIVDFRFYSRVFAFSSIEKSAICILKSKIAGLHYSGRRSHEGKTIEAPSGGS